MKKHLIIIVLLTFTKLLFSQPTEITVFPFSDSTIVDAQPLKISESHCVLTYVWKQKLYSSNTTDNGLNWAAPVLIKDIGSISTYTALKTNTGRLIIIWATAIQFFKIHSDDSGVSWSVQQQIGGTVFNPKNVILTQTSDGTLWFAHSRAGNLYLSKSTDDGNTWSSFTLFLSTSKNTYLSINSVGSGKLLAVFQDFASGNQDIFYSKSNDNGLTWSPPLPILNSTQNEEKPRIIKSSLGLIRLIYQIQKPTPFPAYMQYDIHYLESVNEGESWSTSFQFTRYVDDDLFLGAEVFNDKPMIIFHSKRFSTSRYNELAFGFLGVTIDAIPPPAIFKFEHSTPSLKLPLYFKVYVHDDNGIGEVKAELHGGEVVTLYDDGLHNDNDAGDFIYGNFINIPEHKFSNALTINNVKLPLDNRGVTADVMIILTFSVRVKDIDNQTSLLKKSLNLGSLGHFAESGFLYAGGFMMSGYSNNFLWSNGVATASRLLDYQPGNVGSSPADPNNKLYVLRRNDMPFGTSWQDWRDAVALGAYFYDGDGDGIYNPIDKNGNGRWDANEDMPDILGDETFWCVYNDGIPASQRRFTDVPPQGIEIRQTAFASNKTKFDNTVFIRYSILNKGTVAATHDSVFFSIWTDPDLGDYTDDLVGCDTLLNSGFCYNKDIDIQYGVNVPAFFTTTVQGPLVYTGSSSDTAVNNRGQILGKQTFLGYKNLDPSSFVHYFSSLPSDLNDPGSRFEARNYMLGLNKLGQRLNPCTWRFGEVRGGVNCALINPIFFYSGDPVTRVGWLTNTTSDQRMMLTTGPFKLQINNPIDIIICYTVGRGSDRLNSITKAREITNSVFNEYKSNFHTLTNVEDDVSIIIPSEFKLYQNYPNPFNSISKIKYQIANRSQVMIKVFDVLGREVATLVNEEKPAGTYDVTFDAELYNLTSGVYFYRLTSKNYSETKKLLLLR